jgi:outer membrane biosynthesis protein TonB
VRGFLIFLGLLLVLAGGAVAAVQYAPVDLSVLDSVKGAKEFLTSQMALYAGGGAAGFGLLLIVIAAATGGKKKAKPEKTKASAAKPKAEKIQKAAAPEPATRKPDAAPPKPEPRPDPAPAPVAVAPPPAPKPMPQPAPPPAPLPASAAPLAAPVATTPPPPPPPQATHKPTASGQPPASAAPVQDPRLLNRKRVQDLVTINDALKAYQAKHGAYPKASGLAGFPERGAAWIPGLAPDFLKALPRDPAMSNDNAGPQYVYVSDGADYKLLAQGVSLVGGTNVEVLGVRIDMTRQPTPENAAFGFWTPGFASA